MYSQNDEERIILEFFSGNAEAGRFLDIGAFDGKTFSNTLALAESGWNGTLVEASPDAFVALKREYARFANVPGRRYDLVHACLGFDWRLRTFWDSPDAVATDDPAHMEKWKALGQYHQISVPELPLGALLATMPGPYSFINIDVEGVTTEKLFRAMPIHELSCRLLCVECNDEREKFLAIGRSHNIKPIHMNGENILFAV